MKFIQITNSGVVNWDNYFDYIKKISNRLPANVLEYAENFKHYSLTDKESLHDAWLENLSLDEIRSSGKVILSLTFLGPYHDRNMTFNYYGVSKYQFKVDLGELPNMLHGDVFVHEIREKNGKVEHEILFSTESTMMITCETFDYQEEKLSTQLIPEKPIS